VRHCDSDFFVQAGQELRLLVAPIIDDGFLQAAKRRAGQRGDVIDVESTQDIDHEIGTGAPDMQG
jgi:hypothetical protein